MTDDRDDTGMAVVGRGAALVLAVALLVVLGMLLAPAVAWVGPTGAIGLTVLLFGAVLALPAARFRRWPAQDRTAAVAAVVPALGRATVLTLGLVLLAGLGTASVTHGASPLLPHLWRLMLPDGGVLGLALVAAIVWLWFGHGPGHRGRTPASSVDGRADGRVAAGAGVAPSPNADAS